MADSDQEQDPRKPSEQRGGTTPDEAEAREKGEWAETAEEGIVPAEQGARRSARDLEAIRSSAARSGETTGSTSRPQGG